MVQSSKSTLIKNLRTFSLSLSLFLLQSRARVWVCLFFFGRHAFKKCCFPINNVNYINTSERTAVSTLQRYLHLLLILHRFEWSIKCNPFVERCVRGLHKMHCPIATMLQHWAHLLLLLLLLHVHTLKTCPNIWLTLEDDVL